MFGSEMGKGSGGSVERDGGEKNEKRRKGIRKVQYDRNPDLRK